MIYGTFVAINILIAILNNAERIHNIKTGNPLQVNHTFWFILYSILCVPVVFVSPLLATAVFLQHGWLFPMVYNLIALGYADVFHLSTTTSSKYDQTILKVVQWLNKKFGADLAYSMFLPDLIIGLISIFLLWLY